jgi:hypothetical protein
LAVRGGIFMLKSLTNYHLIFELLHDGKGDLFPDIEPIDTKNIIRILEERSNKSFGADVKKIIKWFMLAEGVATDEDKENMRTIIKIMDIEKKALNKIKGERGDVFD